MARRRREEEGLWRGAVIQVKEPFVSFVHRGQRLKYTGMTQGRGRTEAHFRDADDGTEVGWVTYSWLQDAWRRGLWTLEERASKGRGMKAAAARGWSRASQSARNRERWAAGERW